MCTHNHKRTARRNFLLGTSAVGILALALPLATSARATTKTATKIDLPAPGPYDSCPVCGMFPARYPDWVAIVLFKDGKADHFDGAKDFFKYLLDMKKYAKGRTRQDIKGMGVTDYYATTLIDARQALFVSGSDVLGPMGHELIPHPDAYDAKEFVKDHKGKHLLSFDEITTAIVLGLDDGKFVK